MREKIKWESERKKVSNREKIKRESERKRKSEKSEKRVWER